MKLTTQRLKKLIREELENIEEKVSFKKTGIEKFINPETKNVIVVDHDKKFIEELDPNGKPTGIRFVYDQNFMGIGSDRMGQDKFNKSAKPKDLGVT
tara:strand:- start:185 stop:475 length:291 start_codon:yes stop_codon:yes gene_type:complete